MVFTYAWNYLDARTIREVDKVVLTVPSVPIGTGVWPAGIGILTKFGDVVDSLSLSGQAAMSSW